MRRHAQGQLLAIASVSVLGLAFILFGQLRMLIPVMVCALALGLVMTFLVDESAPGGLERHLTSRPVSSPLDWRVRELAVIAQWPVEGAIGIRRVLFALAVGWIVLSEIVP